jgi:hypothetical protein
MHPPPPIDFASTETVRQLYAAMPNVFVRDIARAKGQLVPPQSMPTLKRERPTEESELAMMKRRDTGESKAGTGMPPPATPSLAPKSVPASAQPFAGSVSQAAMSDRARMVQMRQQHQQQQQQQAQFQAQAPQVQQPNVSGVRQISPPQATNAGTGMGVGVGQPQVQAQQAAAHANVMQQIVNSFGPQGLAFVQQLRDPNSAFVKYMVEQIPNFMSLPLQQQLKSMQQTQVRFTTFTCVLWLTGMSPIARASTEAGCSASAAAATTITTASAAATPTPTTTTTTSTSTTSAAAAITTTTVTTPSTTAAQPPASTAAKHGQSQSRRARGSYAITTTYDRPITK